MADSGAVGLFIFFLGITIVFNIGYWLVNPNTVFSIMIGAITGFVGTCIPVLVVGSLSIFGSGMNTESVKILFGICVLCNILFRVDIAGIPVGVGLANDLLTVFTINDFFGLGFFLAMGLTCATFIAGLITIAG